MHNMLKRSILALILVAAASGNAYARPDHKPHQAPEIDSNLAIGGFTLLAGALTVLRARRSR